MGISYVHEHAHPEVMAWLGTCYAAMRTDRWVRYYWHDAMPTDERHFRTMVLQKMQAVIAHTSSVPEALFMVQMKGVYPKTGESLRGHVSFYVRPIFRSHSKALFQECVAALHGHPLELKATIHPGYLSCRMLARACGFVYKDTLRDFYTFGGRPQDMRLYVYQPPRKGVLDASDA